MDCLFHGAWISLYHISYGLEAGAWIENLTTNYKLPPRVLITFFLDCRAASARLGIGKILALNLIECYNLGQYHPANMC